MASLKAASNPALSASTSAIVAANDISPLTVVVPGGDGGGGGGGGQASVLQSRESWAPSAASHTAPPLAADMDTEYERDCVPVPQGSEQSPQAPHSPSQSTADGGGGGGGGQASVLQSRESWAPSAASHTAPPLAADMDTEYERDCVPVPQGSEQSPQAPHSPTHGTGSLSQYPHAKSH